MRGHNRGSALLEYLLAVTILTIYGMGLLAVAGSAAVANQEGLLLRQASQLGRTQLEKAVWLASGPRGLEKVQASGFAFLDASKRLVFTRRVANFSPTLAEVRILVYHQKAGAEKPLSDGGEPLVELASLVGSF